MWQLNPCAPDVSRHESKSGLSRPNCHIRELNFRVFFLSLLSFSPRLRFTKQLTSRIIFFSPQWSATGRIEINLHIKFHYGRNKMNIKRQLQVAKNWIVRTMDRRCRFTQLWLSAACWFCAIALRLLCLHTQKRSSTPRRNRWRRRRWGRRRRRRTTKRLKNRLNRVNNFCWNS